MQPAPAHTALAYIARLYAIEREAQAETIDLRDRAARTQWYALRGKLRQEQLLPILKQFRAWIEANQLQVLPKSPVGTAMAYVLPRWDGFARYCENGALAIDNNLSERTLRACAIGRKNWMFLGSDRGGRAAAVHYTIMATCKANQVEPFAYVKDILTQLPSPPRRDESNNASRQSNAASNPSKRLTKEDHALLTPLLPNEWLKSNPQAHRRWSR